MVESSKTQLSRLRGTLVSVATNRLGVGKLVDLESGKAIIQYFVSPTDPPVELSCDTDQVYDATLMKETRVYVCDLDGNWQAGRVELSADYEDGRYYSVRFPNKKRVALKEEDVFVRWQCPVEDPTSYLANRLNESLYIAQRRQPFMRALFDQRRASLGMASILSSNIELEAHQLGVVRKVLSDPIQRYLLADEVGLGKTIEAGLILRQHVLDQPHEHRALVVVPETLLEQWEGELRHKFHLGWELDNDTVCLCSTEQLDRSLAKGKWSFLIVDEAHHLAAYAVSHVSAEKRRYQYLESIATQTSSVLLLSATPVLRNEAAFLAMLHLLEPNLYKLEQLESFKQRVQNREEIADLYDGIQEDTPSFMLKMLLSTATERFPNDRYISNVVNDILNFLEQGGQPSDPVCAEYIRSLRLHIGEAYKLHQRLIRNRRTGELAVLVPGRAGSNVHQVPGAPIEAEFLDAWRVEASIRADNNSAWGQIFKLFFEAATSHPAVFAALAKLRLGVLNLDPKRFGLTSSEQELMRSVPLFENEEALLEQIAGLGNTTDTERSNHLLEWFKSNSHPQTLVFASAPCTADTIYRLLADALPKYKVFRHEVGGDWLHGLSQSDLPTVLVCDHTAEEGLNLQAKRVQVVHYDLPASPNRIEQRMGRVDRFGAGQAITSHLFVETDWPLLSAWSDLLTSTIDPFKRSVSSLQYILLEYLESSWPSILHESVDAIESLKSQMADEKKGLNAELKRIEKQDALDSSEGQLETIEEWAEDLWDCDSEQSAADVEDWVVGALQFKKHPYRTEPKDTRAYEYDVKRTLIPVDVLVKHFIHAVDSNAPAGRVVSSPTSFDRRRCLNQLSRMGRVGHPFIDALEAYSRWDDRGISHALWRVCSKVSQLPTVAFCFEFRVECDTSHASKLIDQWAYGTPSSVQRRADGLLLPYLHKIWVNHLGELIDDQDTLSLLESPYNPAKHVRPLGYQDYNLNTNRWETIDTLPHEMDAFDALGVFGASNWRDTCFDCQQSAMGLLLADVDVIECLNDAKNRCQQALDEVQWRCDGRLARSDNHEQDAIEIETLKNELKLLSAIREGVDQPFIRVESAGAVFLSSMNPFA